MSILILSIVLLALALLALAGALKALIATGWFLKWLRGSGGIVLVAITLASVALGYELLTFSKSDEGQVIATLTFDRVADQEFRVELVDAQSQSHNFDLLGDQWQLDVKLVALTGLGEIGQPSYKLDRLAGRYLSLEQEKHDQRSVHSLGQKQPTVGLWQWFMKNDWLPLLKASYGTAAFMPMVDGAIYQVKLYQKGVLAEPVSAQAKEAIESW